MARGRKLAARKGGFLLIKSLFLIEKLFPDRNDILVYKYPTIDQPDVSSYVQRRPGPDDPHWKIPVTEWATVLHRIDQGEPLRKLASHSFNFLIERDVVATLCYLSHIVLWRLVIQALSA